MKKIQFLLLLIASMPFLRLSAQISEIEHIYYMSSLDYAQYTSIVRNYNEEYNVLMLYGYINNTIYDDTVKGRASFMIQNTTTGDVTHIVDLPIGYQVNDVRFVTLRTIDGVHTVDFCCFCGTRTKFKGIEYPFALPDEPSEPIYVYKKHGFAGFFSMDDALNPSSSFTAKVRDVENTKELYRMACYAEEQGAYYYNSYQNSFLDNAVLDIIGLEDTISVLSCFCRAKFYPDCYGGVRWDNNIRFNSFEELTDITKTDDYVVTVSNNIAGDSLCIRYSELEDHLITGGLQLNYDVSSIDFNSFLLQSSCNESLNINYCKRLYPARLCRTKENGVELCYLMSGDSYGGLVNSQYTYSNNTLGFVRGSYLKSSPWVKDLVYMPSNDATAVLYDENSYDYVSVIDWGFNSYCNHPVKKFNNLVISINSLTLQNRNGYEHLFWSGKETGNQFSPMYIMSQRGAQGGGADLTCHNKETIEAQPLTINHNNANKVLPIQIRYPFNEDRYPVLFIHFSPQAIGTDFPCIDE